MKRLWTVIGISVVVILVVMFVITQTQIKKEPVVIKIGAILVLTGPDAKAGESARKGIKMATEEINADGGVRNKKIKVIYEDDAGEPQKSVSAFKKLVSIEKVPAVIGPMWSSCVLAVAPIAEKNKVVVLSPTASNPKITYAGDYIFRNTYSDAIEGAKTAEFAYKELHYSNAAILYVNNDYGMGLKNAFENKFKSLGGKIILSEAYDPKTSDFRTMIAKVKQKKPDFVYLVGYSEMGQILKQAYEMEVNLPVISCVMFEISDILKIAGKAAEGVIYAYPSYDPEKGGSTTIKFAQKFKKKYGIFPDPEAAFSYDAMKILALAMEKGGVSSEKIKDTLYTIKNYNGVSGKTSFDKNGDVIKPMGFKVVKNGKYEWMTLVY